MFDVAISQLSAPRLDLERELAHATAAGLDAISLWRPKLSDAGLGTVATQLACARVRVSSLQWAGGFTAGDGRSFDESLEDAVEAIETARLIAAPVLVVHTGCRGGHTRAHAARLVRDALETLAPVAHEANVTLALRPIHAAVAPGGSLLTSLAAACDFVDGIDHPAVGLAVDLWQFGDAPDLVPMLPRVAARAASVQVADRAGPPSPHADRLPAGHGTLPLERLVEGLCRHGYAGDFEFDPVGEAVESLGHAAVVRETAATAAAWLGGRVANPEVTGWLAPPRILQRRPAAAGAGSLRSHASSHTVSRG
jgi:sugar phosphate isomerase/epimerase